MTEKQKNEEKPEEAKTDMSNMYGQTLLDLTEGELVKGKIVGISNKEVLIDIGYKSEGIIPLSEFRDLSTLKVGDQVEVLLESKEDETGMVVLSKWKADRKQGWDRIVKLYEEENLVEGRVIKKVKGGLIVDVGIEAFLPASLVSLRGSSDLDQLIGQTLEFKIIKINKSRKNVVLSRRDVLQKEREKSRIKLWEGLEKGQLRKGTVKNITDFGAFLDLGGVDGLLHITDMSWGRVSHPSEIVAVGDEIEVVILDIDRENRRVSLGLKQRTPSPWEGVEKKYPVGSKIKGKVVNIMPYGAFVELERGVEGLVHISELSWTKRITNPSEVLAIGDVVEAVVLSIDSPSEKISLGIRQMEANPWAEVATKYLPGTKVKGKVRNITDYGAFVELEDGIDGLIHISDMSWTRRIGHPQEILKKGQKIETVVLSVEQGAEKISLGLKQLAPDPWPTIVEKYQVGLIIQGRITKITTFGIFVELEEGIEGLVHVSELSLDPPVSLEEKFKIDDEVEVKIIRIDNDQRRIGLSMKGL